MGWASLISIVSPKFLIYLYCLVLNLILRIHFQK